MHVHWCGFTITNTLTFTYPCLHKYMHNAHVLNTLSLLYSCSRPSTINITAHCIKGLHTTLNSYLLKKRVGTWSLKSPAIINTHLYLCEVMNTSPSFPSLINSSKVEQNWSDISMLAKLHSSLIFPAAILLQTILTLKSPISNKTAFKF